MPYSPSLHTVTLLSFYRFFVSIQPISVVQGRFWICIFSFLFWCCGFHFQFRFGLFYFLQFTGCLWYFFICPIFTFPTHFFVGIQFGRFLRAGLSSNGSFESLSDSPSNLSSHQIPRCFVSEGTTTAKGLYAYSFFVLNHYAFGGVCATSALRTLAHHFGFGAALACSAAARVTSSLPISGLPFVLG